MTALVCGLCRLVGRGMLANKTRVHRETWWRLTLSPWHQASQVRSRPGRIGRRQRNTVFNCLSGRGTLSYLIISLWTHLSLGLPVCTRDSLDFGVGQECATCLDDPTDTHTQDSSSNLELELEVLVESLLFSESLKRGGSVLSPLSPESRKSIVTRTAKSLAKTLQTMEHMQRGIL